jgi:hypothetical protein
LGPLLLTLLTVTIMREDPFEKRRIRILRFFPPSDRYANRGILHALKADPYVLAMSLSAG